MRPGYILWWIMALLFNKRKIKIVMKKLLLAIVFLLGATLLFAQVNPNSITVRSYHKKNGTYTQSYRRTKPNKTQRDNYSAKENTNPYTYKRGYKKPKK